uniref:Uncharacterized protein n=1 Tax=Anguilla anguilla TaxID=7936 RepID=A0A0E9UDZ3_ANGAN
MEMVCISDTWQYYRPKGVWIRSRVILLMCVLLKEIIANLIFKVFLQVYLTDTFSLDKLQKSIAIYVNVGLSGLG